MVRRKVRLDTVSSELSTSHCTMAESSKSPAGTSSDACASSQPLGSRTVTSEEVPAIFQPAREKPKSTNNFCKTNTSFVSGHSAQALTIAQGLPRPKAPHPTLPCGACGRWRRRVCKNSFKTPRRPKRSVLGSRSNSSETAAPALYTQCTNKRPAGCRLDIAGSILSRPLIHIRTSLSARGLRSPRCHPLCHFGVSNQIKLTVYY